MLKVFVYGSLMKGFGNHTVMSRAQGSFVKKDAIEGIQLKAYCTGFPCAIKKEGFTVQGEVYLVDQFGIKILDQLEGEGQFYHRSVMKTLTGDNVHVYTMNERDAHGEVIKDGSWRSYKHSLKRGFTRRNPARKRKYKSRIDLWESWIIDKD